MWWYMIRSDTAAAAEFELRGRAPVCRVQSIDLSLSRSWRAETRSWLPKPSVNRW